MKGIACVWNADPRTIGYQGMVSFITFILLFCILITAASECRKRKDELSPEKLIDLGNIHEDMVEPLLLNCELELINAKRTVETIKLNDLRKSFYGNGIFSKSTSLERENLPGVSNIVDLHVKRILLECLNKRNRRFLVSGEEKGSKFWYTRYLESWFDRPDAPRRRGLVQSLAETPVPSPAVASPIPSLASSSDSAPSNSEVPYARPPAGAGPPLQPFAPPVINGSALPPTADEHSSTIPNSASDVHSNRQKNSRKTVVVAVVVTATVTFVVVVLLFLCYRRVCRNGAGVRRNDESPLLNLSLSDYSISSSHQSALGKPNDKEKLGNQSVSANFNHNNIASSLEKKFYSDSVSKSKVETSLGTLSSATITSSEDSTKVSSSPLKPPPARLGTFEKPPLKPPPGREALSKTTPNKAAPSIPPHPPLVPPPSINPSSGCPRPPPGPPPSGPPPPPRPPTPGPPLPPPIPSGIKTASRPPPPPSGGIPPPRPPPVGLKPARTLPFGPERPSTSGSSQWNAPDAPKAKLKPFFWDKVLANPDHSMVWHQIKSGSFQFNEEMIETLFGYASSEKSKNDDKKESSSPDPSTQYIQIIDLKKSQNLSILLKALNVTTEEVCDALQEGDELPSEFLQTVLKMAPTEEEELKLRLYSGELSRLGPAQRFLKVLVDIPFAFKRLESLLFMCSLREEVSMVKESFATLEAACTELKKSRLFLKLLEAVLKTGNRMNDGTFRGSAQAFKLDTLLKLSDVRGTDGKTTLLHFVVQEIIRAEGVRAARAATDSQGTSSIKSDDILGDSSLDSEERYHSIGLQVVSGLGSELENVKKAAALDSESLVGTLAKLGHALIKARDFLNTDLKSINEENGFHQTLRSFVQNADVDITWLLEEEKRIMTLVKNTTDYFHGHAGKDEGLRLFVIVQDFLIILDRACKEVRNTFRMPNRMLRKEDSASTPYQSSPDPRQRLFPAITDRRIDSSSSDDDTP